MTDPTGTTPKNAPNRTAASAAAASKAPPQKRAQKQAKAAPAVTSTGSGYLHRPLMIVGGFAVVTLALIFLQPSPDTVGGPIEEVAFTPEPEEPAVEVPVEVAVTRAAPQPITLMPELSAPSDAQLRAQRPQLRPLTLDAEPAPAAIPAAAPQQTGPLFADMAKARPNLLTTTAQDASGRLLPSANATTVVSATDEAAPLTLESIEPLAATTVPVIGNPELRAALAKAPTRAVHTVRLGDSLLTLALRYYGDAEKAEHLLEANRRNMGEDGELIIGQILRIPDIGDL